MSTNSDELIRKDPMNSIDRLFPIREAFALAGLRLTRGYQEVAAGRLKIIRNGKRSFIRASEVQRYIDALSEASDGKRAA
jgi:hypothetical protein